jgi:hypothetical protein
MKHARARARSDLTPQPLAGTRISPENSSNSRDAPEIIKT